MVEGSCSPFWAGRACCFDIPVCQNGTSLSVLLLPKEAVEDPGISEGLQVHVVWMCGVVVGDTVSPLTSSAPHQVSPGHLYFYFFHVCQASRSGRKGIFFCKTCLVSLAPLELFPARAGTGSHILHAGSSWCCTRSSLCHMWMQTRAAPPQTGAPAALLQP